MIHETGRRSGARGLAVATAMTLCGFAPMLAVGGQAHADGPIIPKRGGDTVKRTPSPRPRNARWRAARCDIVLNTVSPSGPIIPGRDYGWSYTVTNLCGVARTVRFSMVLPAGVGYVSSQRNCSVQGGQVVCDLGTMRPGQVISGSLVLRILPGTVSGRVIVINGVVSAVVVRQVRVGSPRVVRWGSLIVQRSFAQVVIAAISNVSVTKSATARVRPGEEVTYQVVVRNHGTTPAPSVVLTDTIQSGQPVVAVKGHATCTLSSGAAPGFVCNLGTMAAGEVRRLVLVARVGAKARPGIVTNTARVSTSAIELYGADNVATARTRVVAPGGVYAAPITRGTPYLGMTELPRTGEQSGRLATASVGLVALGGLLVGASGRRRREDDAGD